MPEPILDGTPNFVGGQNAGLFPDRIGPTQFASGVNLTTIDGTLSPRPGFTEIELTFPKEYYTRKNLQNVLYQKIFEGGKFQSAGDYVSDTGAFINVVISGIIFQINTATGNVSIIDVEHQAGEEEPKSQRLDQYASRLNWANAGRFYVIHDYPDYPVIFDGGRVRRADPAKYEIFPSVLSAFNQTRLFAFSIVNEFTGGDPTTNTLTPNAPITFEEVLAPAAPYSTQIFSTGSTNTNNPITAAGFLQQVDNITGIGPMFVATARSMYMYRTDTPRTDWPNERFGNLVLAKTGIASQQSFVNLNSDFLFIDGSGRIRAFSVAQADQKRWAHVPIDKEVRNYVQYSDPSLIPFCSAGYFNNRAFFCVNPIRTIATDLEGKPVIDYATRGFVSLELDNVSGFAQGATPVWAGLWTGIYPMAMVTVQDQLYIFSKDAASRNVLYRVEPDQITWDTWNNKPKQIRSRIYSRDYNFQGTAGGAYSLKEEAAVLPYFKLIAGDFHCDVEKKSDQYALWVHWRSFAHKAQTQRADFPFDSPMPELLPHSFREINIGSPIDEDACNIVTSEELRYFNKMQLCLTVEGRDWKLDALWLKATVQEDASLISEVCREDPYPKQLPDLQTRVSDWDLYTTFPSLDEEVECL